MDDVCQWMAWIYPQHDEPVAMESPHTKRRVLLVSKAAKPINSDWAQHTHTPHTQNRRRQTAKPCHRLRASRISSPAVHEILQKYYEPNKYWPCLSVIIKNTGVLNLSYIALLERVRGQLCSLLRTNESRREDNSVHRVKEPLPVPVPSDSLENAVGRYESSIYCLPIFKVSEFLSQVSHTSALWTEHEVWFQVP